ncbi:MULTISPECIES: hypothetical protein [Cellulosimicrobium]|jgi:hypothetical protein|uniref:Helix-turn-helix domain-containing protein n=1 Tax=Cellulosimicrobium sp. ES-005 TaxID=3163031 RepID=A0AAU8FWA8_9MICO|nr:hypothetical protein [Cellulosimicrobium cellulans]MCO7275090.1 hypothetical protein [Cellulosimicrobium cellulans]
MTLWGATSDPADPDCGLLTSSTASRLFGVDETVLVELGRRGALRTLRASDGRALYTAGDLLDVVRSGSPRENDR